MNSARFNSLRCILALLVGACSLSAAEEEKRGQTFLRIQRSETDKQPTSLETAIVSYRHSSSTEGDGVTIDLIGAVHIGEKSYYDDLNKAFESYDAVLYELVAPEGNNVPAPGHRSGHPVGVLQVGMKGLLNLEYQLDLIDYQKPNFVHADLSPDEFTDSMAKRDESLSKIFFRLMGQGVAQQSNDPARTSDFAVFTALFSRDRSTELKRTMALQFEQMEIATSVLDGPKGSAIITDRNRRALEVLDKQMKMGKRRLAIFYGAAHLPDFDRNLRDKLGFAPQSTRWLVAWDLRGAKSKSNSNGQ